MSRCLGKRLVTRNSSSVSFISPQAVVHPSAELGTGVRVGPFSVIGPGVVLGSDCTVHSHVVIYGNTRIGRNTEIHPFARLGGTPQDRKHESSQASMLVIGSKCQIREHVTVNSGTKASASALTEVQDRVLLMTGVHVAHDCVVEDNVVLSNGVQLAGHVVVGRDATIGERVPAAAKHFDARLDLWKESRTDTQKPTAMPRFGMSGVHQFVHIGRGSMVGAMTALRTDVIPFTLARGEPNALQGLNLVGLRRANVPRAEIGKLHQLLCELFGVADGGSAIDEPLPTLHARATALLMAQPVGDRGMLSEVLLRFVVSRANKPRSHICGFRKDGKNHSSKEATLQRHLDWGPENVTEAGLPL